MPRISLLLLAAVAACLAVPALAAEMTVDIERIEDRKAVLAVVTSIDTSPARARISGTVDSLDVDEGDRVGAGERLAFVDDPKLPLRLNAIDAEIAALESQRDLAETELKRARQLKESGTGTQARLDQAENELRVVEGRLGAAEAQRGVIAEQLVEANVLAPVSGRILRVHVTQGQVVLPGEAIATVALERYVIRLELPERHARFLKEGDRITVGARGLNGGEEGGTRRPGEIIQVYPELEDGRVVADARASGIGDYFVGERIRVYIATGHRDAIVVPAAAISRRFGLTFVTVKDVGEVAVQLGEDRGDNLEVLSGLQPGDVLVVP